MPLKVRIAPDGPSQEEQAARLVAKKMRQQQLLHGPEILNEEHAYIRLRCLWCEKSEPNVVWQQRSNPQQPCCNECRKRIKKERAKANGQLDSELSVEYH